MASEITVTGERAAKPAGATSSSVSVINADTVEALSGTDRLDQALALTPNLQFGSGGEGPTIRGQDSNGPLRDLPAFLGGNRPRVTLQVDGRPVSYNELAFGVTGLWDVARIEVFRSPQTTTQGQNAIGGAIFVETAAPAFDWQGRMRGVASEADARQFSATLSGPILADQLAFRASSDVRRSRTSSRIISTAVGADYNRDEYNSLRFKLLATPRALPGLRISAVVSHNQSSGPQFEGVRAPFTARRDPVATYGVFKVRVDALTLRLDYPFSSTWTANAILTKGDATVRRSAPDGFGVARIDASDYTVEAVLNWRPNDRLTLLAGANSTHTALNQQIDLRAASLGMGQFRDRQDALGLFGQAEWRIWRRLTLTAGARYQRDDQVRAGILGIGNPAPLALNYQQYFARFLPKVTATFEIEPEVRFGVLIQRAYNPGGVTLDAARRVTDTFDAETLWAYEGFIRLARPQSRVSLSANVFSYDIKDAQRSLMRELLTPGGIVTVAEIDNAPQARTSGAEFEAEWRPLPGVDLRGAVGLLRTRLTRALAPGDPLSGKEFQRSPHFTGSLALDWRPTPTVRLSAQARRNTGYFSDDTNDPARRIPGVTVADLRGAWTTGGMTVAGYVRNLFGHFYLTYLFSPTQRLATAGDPREVGASVEFRF